MSTTSLEIDLQKVTFPNGGSLSGDGDLYYDGVHVGRYHRVSGYPPSVTNLAGKRAGFNSASEAVKFLVASMNAKEVPGNIFPDAFYILRVSEILVSTKVTAKIHYNSKNSTGSSAASKPCLSEMVEIDLDNEEISTKNDLSFANQSEIIEKIKALIKEKL